MLYKCINLKFLAHLDRCVFSRELWLEVRTKLFVFQGCVDFQIGDFHNQHLEYQYLNTRDLCRLFTDSLILLDVYMGYPHSGKTGLSKIFLTRQIEMTLWHTYY